MKNTSEPIRLSPKYAALQLEKLKDSPDFTEEQRHLIHQALSGSLSNGQGAVKVMEAIVRGDWLNDLQATLKKPKVSDRDIQRMRELVSLIGDEGIIINQLGSEAVRRYFQLMESRMGDKPYLLPLTIEDEELPAYLGYELGRGNPAYQDSCALEVFQQEEGDELKKVDLNLVLTHFLHHPGSLNTLYESDDYSFDAISGFTSAACRKTDIVRPGFGVEKSFYAHVLEYLTTDKGRLKNIKKLNKRAFARAARGHIKKMDAEFLRKLNANFFY